MSKYNIEDFDEEFELDEDLKEKFGEDVSSVQKHIENKAKTHKNLKFKKDGFYEKNRK